MSDETPGPSAARTSEPPPVDELLVELLQRTEGDPGAREAVVDELCRRWPSRERKLRAAVRNLSSAGLIEVDELPEAIGEFRPIRRLGGGGMGVVLLADQPSLDRRVAIKLLRTDELLRSGARDRFQRETAAVARLAHPNVVSVHAIGSDAGVPYLVMDHVEGASLDRILAAQSGRRPEELTGDDFLTALRAEMAGHGDVPHDVDEALFEGSWIDVCLRVARDVAGALAHAHSRGVLHRDVKPSNVMVTPTGRVLLVDFGLAAVLDAERITRTGTQMGSLPYLPPEHVSGDAEPSARGDVYSLGVALTEMLMLRLPFEGRGTQRIRADIEEGRLLSARSSNPAVSADLDTVLRCATDHDPERRYASASAFAADLTNVLEGDPIAARPASLVRRVGRWVRRRPELASLVALSALVAVGGPIAYAEIQRRHADDMERVGKQLSASLEKEIEARERADENHRRATEAIVRVTGHMAGDGLEHEPRMQRARLDIAEDAIRIFGALIEERPDDDDAAFHWAELHLVRGEILVELERIDEGIADLEEHQRVIEELLARDPGSLTYRYAHAAGLSRIADAERAQGRASDAIAKYREAAAALGAVAAEAPDVGFYAQGHAQALVSHGLALATAGRVDESETVMREALPLARALTEERPSDDETYYVLAQALRVQSHLAELRADREGVARISGEALDAARRALELAPGHRHYQLFVVEMTDNRVVALARLGRIDEALAVLDEGERTVDDLARRYPSIYTYHQRRIEFLMLRAFVAAEAGDHLGAVSFVERGLEIHDAYGVDEAIARDVGRSRAMLLATLAGKLVLCVDLGPERFVRAEESAREALLLMEEVDERNELRLTRYNLCLAIASQDRVDEAIEAAEVLAEESLDMPEHQRFLADAWCEIHAACLRQGLDAEMPRDRALELLAHAVELGYRDRRELSSTPVLEPLRKDPRFQAILRSIEPRR